MDYRLWTSYLKLAWRNLWRHRAYSFINLLGLAIGMVCCALMLLYVFDELSYDQHFANKDRIYRMALERSYPGRSTSYAIIPISYAEAIEQEYPEVEETARLVQMGDNVNVRIGDQLYEETNGYWADSTFFTVFDIPLLHGEAGTALNRPHTLVLSESTAQKYFGTANALGRTIEFPGLPEKLTVTGVTADLPENTHFDFHLLVALAGGPPFLQGENFINFSAYTYLLLQAGADVRALEQRLPDLVTKYVSGPVQRQFGVSYEEYQRAGNGYRYFLQPLTSIHLESNLEAELKPPGSKSRVYIFSIIAFFILLIACINYMNLATARSAERAQEVAIRKTLGSHRRMLAGQFLTEAVLLSLFSFVLAAGLLSLALPYFNQLSNKSFQLADLLRWDWLALSLVLAILVGLLAGSYPAFSLSRFLPVQMMRGSLWARGEALWLRNGLVVFQFAVSVLLIACTLVVFRQLHFLQNKSLGFDKEHIINIDGAFNLEPQQLTTFTDQLEALPGVAAVSTCSQFPGQEQFFGITFQAPGDPETVTGRGMIVGDGYFECMQMEMADGRGFAESFSDSTSLVINEAAARELGLSDPIGKYVTTPDEFLNPDTTAATQYTIVGIVKDFHFQSLHQRISPLFFVHQRVVGNQNGLVTVRVKPEQLQTSLLEMEAAWANFAPEQAFRFSFLTEELNQLYAAEQTAGRVVTAFSLIAIFIACLGLLGLAAYVTRRRVREIGIRKVLGASSAGIIALLSRDFLRLVLVAIVIALPLAWWAMHRWLENFAYHVSLEWWVFGLASCIALLIAFLTVSFQSLRAARANPVRTLRQ